MFGGEQNYSEAHNEGEFRAGTVIRCISSGFPIFIGRINCQKMISTTDIRNRIIDQLLAIKDADYLRALSDMIKNSHVQEEVVPLTEEQKIMLAMSEEDIEAGRTIDQHMLNERELQWLKEK
jgi:hypothetical protein